MRKRNLIRRLTGALAVWLLMTGLTAGGARAATDVELPAVREENAPAFGELLTALEDAYEKPAEGREERIDALLEEIRGTDEADYETALAIAAHWRKIYLDPDYPLYVYDGKETAEELEGTEIPNSPTHAFVVLGYQLENGEMTKELKGRCKAAAAAALKYPDTILVCSGGATGRNNPKRHTEAGMMKNYLVKKCGIDAERIFIDERAMSTAENAVNTFRILQEQGVETITIVTSTYHQLWGQAVYNAAGALYRQAFGYSAEIVANYSYKAKPSTASFRKGWRIAAKQIAGILQLPKEATAGLH